VELPDAQNPKIDKALIDTSPVGQILFSSERNARVEPSEFSPVFDGILSHLADTGTILDVTPLRLMLFTPDLSESVKSWQRELALPEAGTSKQPEGEVGGKTMSWGADAASARTIVLLYDALAYAATQNNSAAISTVAHELGHVSDYFLRGLCFGFPVSSSVPAINDWPGICTAVADSVWSEYSAESAASAFMSEENIEEFRANDMLYLAGIDGRLRELTAAYKFGQLQLASLWSRSVTDLFNSFSNLGRAGARLPANFDESIESRRLAGQNGAAQWAPVIEKLFTELRALRTKQYEDWPLTPFAGIEEAVKLGFHTVGLFPAYDGLDLRIRVR